MGQESVLLLSKNDHPSLAAILAMVFAAMLVVMFLYELGKQVLNPSISLWESHVATIIFTSMVSVAILYFPLSSLFSEQEKTKAALLSRKETEDKLRESEARYRSFIESAEDSIYTVDRDLKYLLINTQHLARRGIPPEIYTGRSYGDFHSREETAAFETRIRLVVDARTPVQDEYTRNGNTYLRKLNPVIDPRDGRVIAVTVVSSDITDRKRVEKSLEITNRKLNLMNDITRHDILNQLTILDSFLYLAREQIPESRVQEYLERCTDASDTIRSQILFARDYQKIGIESPRWQNVCGVIGNARQALNPRQVLVDPSSCEWEIYADPLLEKVFFNLLDNAQRYAGPDPEIRFHCEREGKSLVIFCADNGPGIPVNEKESIFSRGFGKNTGLGLFLIREILAMTGITIRETGEPGHGSRFEILVPDTAFRPVKTG